jgi:RNA polymerase sigma factor (sigma-70 family)
MPDPTATIESLWEEDAVLSAIQQLPLKEKQVFALHFDQLKTSEIAEILEMTPDAVRQNLARACTGC